MAKRMTSAQSHNNGNSHSPPVPDPTTLTTEQLLRAIEEERRFTSSQLDILKERLNGIDTATTLRIQTFDEIPEHVDEKVGHLAGLMEERFGSIAIQFKERDTRSERESRDNKVAVDAAFAAQKEAAAKQDEANQKSIDKSEKATNESIDKLGAATEAANRALSDKLDDIKERIGRVEERATRIEAQKLGGAEAITEKRAISGATYAAIGVVLSLLLTGLAFVGFLLANQPLKGG